MHNIEEVEQLALQLMKQHGLLGKGWVFEFDNAKRRFGQADSARRTISMSKPIVLLNLSNDGELRNVILHEIAHGLATRVSLHNAEWRTIARSIGCTGDRCYDNNDVIDPPSKYICFCKRCGKVWERMKGGGSHACPPCCLVFNKGVFSHKYRIITREREVIEAAGGIEAYKQEWAREHGVTFYVHEAAAHAA